MGEILLPLLMKHWKTVSCATAGIAMVSYVAFLHHVINNDHVMLDAAHDQMTKLSTEYRADVEAMTRSIKAQNDQIAFLSQESKVAKDTLVASEKASNAVRSTTQAQVNGILSKPVPVGCQNSINAAIIGVKDLQWESIK